MKVRRGFQEDVTNSEDQWLFPLSDGEILDQTSRRIANDQRVAEDLNDEIFSAPDRRNDLWIRLSQTLNEQGLSRGEVSLVLIFRLYSLVDDLLPPFLRFA